jgi:hypothetical protein
VAGYGQARQAGHGSVGSGAIGLGMDRLGRHGTARRGMAWMGTMRHGKAGMECQTEQTN